MRAPTFTYDPNGNLTTKTEGTDSWGYEWNANNELIRVTKNSVEQARFSYDPLGRRVEKIAGSVTTSYTYDADDILRQVRGATTFKYVHGPGVDEPLAREDGSGALTYYQLDGLGSIVKRTSQAGAVVHEYRYDAWGNIETGASEPGYSFTSREWDPEVGLYYYRVRYYDPRVGRFASEDPIGFAGGDINLYAYVKSGPTNWVDPSGLQALPPDWACQAWNTYWEMHWRRGQGHQRFPREENSFMRHCVTSCEAARSRDNANTPRFFGVANEFQGFFWHDIWNLGSRMSAQTPWAFQFEDMYANEVGFACSGRKCESCVDCCAEAGRGLFGF